MKDKVVIVRLFGKDLKAKDVADIIDSTKKFNDVGYDIFDSEESYLLMNSPEKLDEILYKLNRIK